jgi:hypothetical protein
VPQCRCVSARLEENRDSEPGEHDRDAGRDVDHEVVRRGHDRERHRDRQRDGHDPKREGRHSREEHDADEHVPAGVKARKCGVLVRQARRLERAVGVGALRHRVDEPDVEQARRRDGKEGEEEEADQAGGDHRVAEEVVLPPPVDVEPGRGAEDDGPVTPDVDPVRDVDEDVAAERRRLDGTFPADSERVFERDHAPRVRERGVGASRREIAHGEVDDDRHRDDHRLTRELAGNDDAAPPPRRGRAVRRPSRHDRSHPHLLARVSFHRRDAASAISRNRGA